jgi:hypothetical protein
METPALTKQLDFLNLKACVGAGSVPNRKPYYKPISTRILQIFPKQAHLPIFYNFVSAIFIKIQI